VVKYTPNYNLGKPEGTDMYSILPQNTNMDIIDTTLKKIETDAVNAASDASLSLGKSTDTSTVISKHLAETKKWVTVLSLQTQAVLNDTNVDIAWTSVTPRNNADFASIENGKIILKPGLYQVNVFVMFDSNPVGGRFVNVENAVDGRQAISTSTYTPVSIGVLVQKNIQGELSIKVNQNSGGALNIIGGNIHAQIAKVADVI